MADAAVVLVIRRHDERTLSDGDRRTIAALISRLDSDATALEGELGDATEWQPFDPTSHVVQVAVFKHWLDDVDLNVLNADGSISPPTYETMVIEGEEVAVPSEPPEGNPGPDEMLSLLLERDKSRVERFVNDTKLRAELGPELVVEVVCQHW